MTRSVCTFTRTAILAAAVFASPLAAQFPGSAGQRLVRVGFGGGLTVPVGDADEAWETGLNGQFFLLISPGFLPPIRVNLGYEKFDFKDALLGAVTGNSNVLSGVAGIQVPLVELGAFTPYLMAGLGAFRIDQDPDSGADPEADIRFGIDGGAGVRVRLGPIDGFVEGRVQNVYTEAGLIDTETIRYVPITFGILF